ncbi:uncharacterized protein [Oscarella lobularis]|uniref:uncharacterized protein n=1 Tax=Oscarella lobularis TaxID=121494 RepID=UPI0033132C22
MNFLLLCGVILASYVTFAAAGGFCEDGTRCIEYDCCCRLNYGPYYCCECDGVTLQWWVWVAISVGVVVLICIGIVIRFYIYRRRRTTVVTTHAQPQPVSVTTSQQQQQQYVMNPPPYERFQ